MESLFFHNCNVHFTKYNQSEGGWLGRNTNRALFISKKTKIKIQEVMWKRNYPLNRFYVSGLNKIKTKCTQKTSGGFFNSSKQVIDVQSFCYIAQLHWICWDDDSWWRQQLSHYRMTDFKLLYNPSQTDLTDFPDQHLLLGIMLTHLNAPNCQSFFFYRGAHTFRFAFDWLIMNQCVICHLVT